MQIYKGAQGNLKFMYYDVKVTLVNEVYIYA